MTTSEITHRTVSTNGINMHIAEAGEGPLVLLCHGWPESWYSWRHQIPALVAAGYHVVAPDMRGYGQTDAPDAVDQYTIMHLVGDMTGLIDACGEEQAVIVGHDWGSIVAWNAALMVKDRFRAVCGMSVPFMPRAPMSPLKLMKAAAGDRFLYILYFQTPGPAEAEFEADIRLSLRKLYYTASGSLDPSLAMDMNRPKDAGFLGGMHDVETLPDWLTPADLDYYVGEFEHAGFRGGMNWYRNFDRNWELQAPWAGAKVQVPALFIGGLRDGVVTGPGGKGEGPLVKMLGDFVPHLADKILIEGAGHWNQQEAPEETNRALIAFLDGLPD